VKRNHCPSMKLWRSMQRFSHLASSYQVRI
jgi:hypothetical protein